MFMGNFFRCKCLLQLGQIESAQSSFDEAVDAIDRSGLQKTLRKGIATELQAAFLNLTNDPHYTEEDKRIKAHDGSTDEDNIEPISPLPEWAKMKGRHKNFPAASR